MTRRILFLSCPLAAFAVAWATLLWYPPGTAMGLRAESATSQASPKDGSAGLDPLKAKLREQRAKIKSLYAEYRFETEALVDPKILPRWQILEIHPYRAEEHVGVRDRQRYLRRILPDGLRFITPPGLAHIDVVKSSVLRRGTHS